MTLPNAPGLRPTASEAFMPTNPTPMAEPRAGQADLNAAAHFCQHRRYHNFSLLVSFVSGDPRN
jgi:hypothetical protein